MLPWLGMHTQIEHPSFQSYGIVALDMDAKVGNPGCERSTLLLTVRSSDAHVITCFRSCYNDLRLLHVLLYIVACLPDVLMPGREPQWGLAPID